MEKYKNTDEDALNNIGNKNGSIGEWKPSFLYEKETGLENNLIFALEHKLWTYYDLAKMKIARLK